MNLKGSKKKKYLIFGTITSGVLAASITTPLVILNSKNDKVKEDEDINKIVEILKNKCSQEKIIELTSNTNGKIVANNQEKIIEKIKTLIGQANLKDVKVEVLMKNDTNISTIPQKIIIKLSKNEISKEIKDFLVKKKNVLDEDINKIVEILQAKTTKEKIIELSNSVSGKIIANNQDKIVEKIKTLIGKANLKDVKIEVLMQKDTNISIVAQKIIVKLTKNEISKEVKDFLVKKQNVIYEEIESIKNVLDAKTGEDLIITLPSDSTGNIIGEAANKNAIEKKLRILVDPSNTNGENNHSSLKGTSIEVSMDVDTPISTTAQDVIVSISKSGGTTLKTTKTFQVKRDFTADEDIAAIKAILDTKRSYHDGVLFITLPVSSEGSIIAKLENKNMVEKKVRRWINPLNTNGDPNHSSLRGTTITLTRVIAFSEDLKNIERDKIKQIVIEISKIGGTSVEIRYFFVTKSPF